MRARHRLSKLLLHHGIVSSGGKASPQAHDAWLLRQSFALAGTQAAFEDAYEAVVLVAGRRLPVHPRGAPPGLRAFSSQT